MESNETNANANNDTATAAPALGHYAIDPAASTVEFTTRHVFGLLPVRGTFTIRSGSVDIAEPLGGSGVRAEIGTASFSTGSRQRDRAVRSARFLDAERHPLMTFTGDRVDGTTVPGTLTVCGVARPVSLRIEESASTTGGVHRPRHGPYRPDRIRGDRVPWHGRAAPRGDATRPLRPGVMPGRDRKEWC
ncbi:YceI family protein [Streptomyces xanthochromogenes]|uniref:Lipid/polyisoprenoid-binding YceI-like domain-containing protein n=1 Tax=Streptomyces xanthochromogenes TaxID=67384 RepID=A0ABQ2ZKZ7_9ACTN|nr:YceI family protein [Streptomyces xanthochromogenes]GGY19220.1 hypothetical protein GCM10010326_10190 [Streptomyces xanthochromogenes]